jgi:hypothetical protein
MNPEQTERLEIPHSLANLFPKFVVPWVGIMGYAQQRLFYRSVSTQRNEGIGVGKIRYDRLICAT